MTSRSRPKAVVFDLDGVYFEGGTERFLKNLKRRYGIGEEQAKAVYLKSPPMREYKRGEIDGDTFWAYAIRTWNIDATKDELLDLLIASYTENKKTIMLIDTLRTRGVKTAVCTNNFPERIDRLDQRFGFKKRFDIFITSYEEGILKPDSHIFMRLAERLGLAPTDILMSDDREENVAALQTLGFQAFLYEGFDDFAQQVTS